MFSGSTGDTPVPPAGLAIGTACVRGTRWRQTGATRPGPQRPRGRRGSQARPSRRTDTCRTAPPHRARAPHAARSSHTCSIRSRRRSTAPRQPSESASSSYFTSPVRAGRCNNGVGWVERSEPHRNSAEIRMVGLAAPTHPTIVLSEPGGRIRPCGSWHDNSTPRWMMCKCNRCFPAQPQIEWYTCVDLAGQENGAAQGEEIRRGECDRERRGKTRTTAAGVPPRRTGLPPLAGLLGRRRGRRSLAGQHPLRPLVRRSGGRSNGDSTLAMGRRRLLAAGKRRGVSPRRPGGAPTTIFIHGNRTDSELAVEHGWLLYGHMEEAARGKPFRLVIWSWPADRAGRRPRADAQEKAEYSDVQAYYLARFLGDMRADVPVCLVGYSFGADGDRGARVARRRVDRLPNPSRQPPRRGPSASSSWPLPPTPIPSCPAIATAMPSRLSNACWRRRTAATGR